MIITKKTYDFLKLLGQLHINKFVFTNFVKLLRLERRKREHILWRLYWFCLLFWNRPKSVRSHQNLHFYKGNRHFFKTEKYLQPWISSKPAGDGGVTAVVPRNGGGSPEYYGCYTPISGRFRRDPGLQVFFRFEEMTVLLVEMKILMWSHGICPNPEKKTKTMSL